MAACGSTCGVQERKLAGIPSLSSLVKYEYTAYGLSLRSDVQLPGLSPGSRAGLFSPVEFTSRTKPDWALAALNSPGDLIHSLPAEPECGDPTFLVRSYDDGKFFQLAYGDGTEFFVDERGERVSGSYVDPLTVEDLATYFLGPVLGFVLRRRGVSPLHASAVCIDGMAVVISGGAGSGKSTTAAALALRGAPALCEDIAALDEIGGQFYVRPGYPRICLWPDAVEKLLGDRAALPDLTPTWDKKFLDGKRAKFADVRMPLGAIYLLNGPVSHADAPRMEEISAREALLELVHNTYMNALLTRQQRAEEFELLSRLVMRVPCKRVTPHRNASNIGAMCELLERDAHTVSARRRSLLLEGCP